MNFYRTNSSKKRIPTGEPEAGDAMLFHSASHTTAQSARVLRSKSRPSPVQNPKTPNRMRDLALTISACPDLLQMRQPRHCIADQSVFHPRNASATDHGQGTTGCLQNKATAPSKKAPPQRPITVFPIARHIFLTKQTHRAFLPLSMSLVPCAFSIVICATPSFPASRPICHFLQSHPPSHAIL